MEPLRIWKKMYAWFLGIGLTFAPQASRADTDDAGIFGISLDQARRRAETHAPAAQIASSQIREAQATRVGAGVWLPINPRLSVDGRRALDASSGSQWGYGVGLDALFEVGGAPRARVREADARVRVARSSLDVVCLESRIAATDAYVSTALARIRNQHARESLTISERLLDAARERLAAGAGSDVEVSSAEIELAEAQAELEAAHTEEQLQQMELRRLAQLPTSRGLRLTSRIEAPPEALSAALLLVRARVRQPDIADANARLALLDASDERLGKEAFPKVGAFGLLDVSPASPRYGLVGISVELPVAQRNQGPRAVIAAQRQTESARRTALIKQIELEIVHRRDAHEAARGELSVVVMQAIPAAERRLALVEEGWRIGRFDIFRVTAATRDLIRLRALRIDALRRIWTQRLALERITGVNHDDQQ